MRPLALLPLLCSLLAACPPAAPSGSCAQDCQGCCDASGTCRDGASSTGCGAAGRLCAVCAADQQCVAGACVSAAPDLDAGTSDGGLTWPDRVDFGSIPPSHVVERDVQLANGGRAAVTVSLSTLRAEFQVDGDATVTIAAGSTVPVRLRFAPTVPGAWDDVLTLSVGGQRAGSVLLSGVGGGPVLAVQPASLDFGVVSTGSAAARELRVTNAGTFTPPLHLGLGGQLPWFELRGGSAADFEVTVAPTYVASVGLEPNASTQLTVRLAERATPGLKTAELVVFSTDPLTPTAVVPLTADARDLSGCALTASGTSLDFGQVGEGATKTLELVLSNGGATDCSVSSLQLQRPPDTTCGGVTCLNGTTCVLGRCQTRPTGFALAAGTPTSELIAPGQALRVPIHFTAPLIRGQTDSMSASLSWVSEGPRRTTTATLSASVLHECLALLEHAWDFGTVGTGCSSGTRTVEVYNTCPLSLSLSSLSTSGAAFSITGPPTSTALGPMQKLTLGVRYTPTRTGPERGAALVTVWQGGSLVTYRLALEGVGAPSNANVDRFEVPPRRTDVLFVVDDSATMPDKQAALAAQSTTFLTTATAAMNDFRIGVVPASIDQFETGQLINDVVLTPTTPMLGAALSMGLRHRASGGPTEACAQAALLALGTPAQSGQRYLANAGFLRDDASLAVVCVTDAPDQSLAPPDAFVNLLTSIKGRQHPERVSYSVFAPLQQVAPTECLYDAPVPNLSTTHQEMAAALGGRVEEICSPDWASAVSRVAQRVFAEEGRTFSLTRTPTGAPTVKLNGTALPASGWTLSSSGGRSVLRLAQSAAPGAVVAVEYDAACQ